MVKQKNKTVEVELEDGTKVKLLIKRPTQKDLSLAQKIGSKVWTDGVREGLFTKQSLAQFMEREGIWNDLKESKRDEIASKINRLEKDIALGRSSSGGKMKVSEGKEKALELRRLRNALRELISERISLEANTAEGLAENSKFNYLVSACTFYESGEKVYKNLDDYDNRSDDEIAFHAASALGELMYQLDQSYEEKLPENQFLKKFNLVDDELSLIDRDGNRVDVDGTKVNEEGWLVNDEGQRIDREGNLLNEDGYIMLQGDYEDDINVEEKPKAKRQTKKAQE